MTARLRIVTLGGGGCGGCCAVRARPVLVNDGNRGCERCKQAGAAAGGVGVGTVAGLPGGSIDTEEVAWTAPLLLDGMDGGGGVHSGGSAELPRPTRLPPRLCCAGDCSAKPRSRDWDWAAGAPRMRWWAGRVLDGGAASRGGGLLGILTATPFFLVETPSAEDPTPRTGLSPPSAGLAPLWPHNCTLFPAPSSPPLYTRPTQLLLPVSWVADLPLSPPTPLLPVPHCPLPMSCLPPVLPRIR
eukprot:455374-Pelagomonas_calceolata.AAC.2